MSNLKNKRAFRSILQNPLQHITLIDTLALHQLSNLSPEELEKEKLIMKAQIELLKKSVKEKEAVVDQLKMKIRNLNKKAEMWVS